jgi:two-component system, sensor histidine kinase and response regulator
MEMNFDELTTHQTSELEQLRAERDEARAQLMETRNMLQMVMDNLPQQIYWKNRRLEYLGCNKLYVEQFGLENPEDLFGKTENECAITVEDSLRSLFKLRETEVMEHGIPQYNSLENIAVDGEQVWLDLSHVPLFRDGEIIGVLGTYRDITDRVTNEEELKKHRDHLSDLVKMRTLALEAANQELADINSDLGNANRALAEANKAKGQFVANISHEIRTPLNAVVAMTELMLDTQISQMQQEYLTTILDSADSLLFTINDLLDYSKIEAGKLELELVKFNLRETIESAMRSLSVKAYEKDIELLIDVDPNIPGLIKGDPLRLRQIILNLIGNSIKFTFEGEIAISVKLNELTDHYIDLQFCFSDTGIGIPKERQVAIFNAFEQVDNSTTRNFGGSGLGLSIVSQLVELMHGSISLRSEMGKGSEFSFNLVFELVEESFKGRRRDPVGKFSGKSALILDDNKRYIEILDGCLKRWGFEVQVVEDFEVFRQTIPETQSIPDLLIVDSMMKSPMEVIRVIGSAKKQWGEKCRILFMLKKGGMLTSIEADSVLFDSAYMFKPIVDFELCEKLQQVFCSEEDDCYPLHTCKSVSLHSGESLNVLFVDDRPLNQKIGKALLTKFGHKVEFADNGEEAVKKSANSQFDIVLMDIQMPNMDGYEATRLIREREKKTGVHIPIIAVTANALKGEGERTLEAGMDSYIPKPIRSEHLQSTLDAVMKQRQEDWIRKQTELPLK